MGSIRARGKGSMRNHTPNCGKGCITREQRPKIIIHRYTEIIRGA